MKKQLDTHGILNELKRGSRYFSPASEHESEVELTPPPSAHEPTEQATQQSTVQSTDPSTNQPTAQPTKQPTDATYYQSAILGRPKAFYITAQQDADLDTAVARLAERVEGKLGQKIDRSTVMRLLLEQANLTHAATIDKLYSQLVSRLISQLSG